MPSNEDPNHFAYVKDDTWLLDYVKLNDVYGEHFGFEHLLIHSYDNALMNDGMLPSLFSAIGIHESADNMPLYWSNKT